MLSGKLVGGALTGQTEGESNEDTTHQNRPTQKTCRPRRLGNVKDARRRTKKRKRSFVPSVREVLRDGLNKPLALLRRVINKVSRKGKASTAGERNRNRRRNLSPVG